MGAMKAPGERLVIPPDIAAKCDGPDQFQNFDRLFRTVIVVPKAEIDKREVAWKRKQARVRSNNSKGA